MSRNEIRLSSSASSDDSDDVARNMRYLANAERFATDLSGAGDSPAVPAWAPAMLSSWLRALDLASQQTSCTDMLAVISNWLLNGDGDFAWDGDTGPTQLYDTRPSMALYFAMEALSPTAPAAGDDPYKFFRDVLDRITPNDGAAWFHQQCVENQNVLKAYVSHTPASIEALLDPNSGFGSGTQTIGGIVVPDYAQIEGYITDLDLPGFKDLSDWISSMKNPAWTDSSQPGQFVCNPVQVYRYFQSQAFRDFTDWVGNYNNVVLTLAQWERKGQKVEVTDAEKASSLYGPPITISFAGGVRQVMVDKVVILAPKYEAQADQPSAYPTLSWSEDDGNPHSAVLYFNQIVDLDAENGWVGNSIWGHISMPKGVTSFYGIPLSFGDNDHADIAIVAEARDANANVPADSQWYAEFADPDWWKNFGLNTVLGFAAFGLLGLACHGIWKKVQEKGKQALEKWYPDKKDTLDKAAEQDARAQIVDPPAKPVPGEAGTQADAVIARGSLASAQQLALALTADGSASGAIKGVVAAATDPKLVGDLKRWCNAAMEKTVTGYFQGSSFANANIEALTREAADAALPIVLDALVKDRTQRIADDPRCAAALEKYGEAGVRAIVRGSVVGPLGVRMSAPGTGGKSWLQETVRVNVLEKEAHWLAENRTALAEAAAAASPDSEKTSSELSSAQTERASIEAALAKNPTNSLRHALDLVNQQVEDLIKEQQDDEAAIKAEEEAKLREKVNPQETTDAQNAANERSDDVFPKE